MSIFTETELTEIGIACYALAIAVAKADTEAGEDSLAISIAAIKDVFTSPERIRQALLELESQPIFNNLKEDLELLIEQVEKIDWDEYSDSHLAMGWEERLSQTAQLLDSKLNPMQAMVAKQMMLEIGKRTADASGGGYFGLDGQRSAHESKRLAEIAHLLGLG